MKHAIEQYQTLVFDCDGVLLNSNRIKTEAFRRVALQFGEAVSVEMVQYHVANGGVSRYRKLAWLLERVFGQADAADLQPLLDQYAQILKNELLNAEADCAIETIRRHTPDATWMIVSGGDQAELRQLFAKRQMDHLFDGGIFGSPDTKEQILQREHEQGVLRQPALFLGDSRYDHEAARQYGLDFVFVSHWTELDDYQSYCDEHQLSVVDSLAGVLDIHS